MHTSGEPRSDGFGVGGWTSVVRAVDGTESTLHRDLGPVRTARRAVNFRPVSFRPAGTDAAADRYASPRSSVSIGVVDGTVTAVWWGWWTGKEGRTTRSTAAAVRNRFGPDGNDADDAV